MQPRSDAPGPNDGGDLRAQGRTSFYIQERCNSDSNSNSHGNSIGSSSITTSPSYDDEECHRHHRHHHQHHRHHPRPDQSSPKPKRTSREIYRKGRRRRRRRESFEYTYGDDDSPWSPWSRWRLALKLVYAVVVPAVVIYLLGRFDRTLQQRNQILEKSLVSSSDLLKPKSSSSSSSSSWTINVAQSTVPVPSPSITETHQEEEQHPYPQQQQQQKKKKEPQSKEDNVYHAVKSSPLWETLTDALSRFVPFHLQHSYRSQKHSQHPIPSRMVQHIAFDSFLLLGDSITQHSFNVKEQGFGAQLAHLYQRRLDIINRGFSGYTTEQAIHLLPQFLPRSQHQSQNGSHQKEESQSPSTSNIQFLTIFYGANDACLAPSPQHVDLARYEENIRTLIDMVHSPDSSTYSPETKVIVICPPPINEDRWALRRKDQGMKMDRDKDVTRRYAEACLRIGKEYRSRNRQQQAQQCQVDVIDTWGIMMEQVRTGKHTLDGYLKDGLHLASEGNNVIFEEIMKVIKSRYPEWDPSTMPMHAPWWGHLDRNSPEDDLMLCGNKAKP
ncbi:hypothetical protein BGX28_009234 [Mortierella sp. GBA30]|nr:hypothetical protein BGX28_009234 [Mortierella sp. GBA30]